MKNETYVTTTLLGEKLDKFIAKSVKRSTPIPIGLDSLFYIEDEEDEGFGYFYPTEFRNYLNELTSGNRQDLKTLFDCLNNNIEIRSKVVDHSGSKVISVEIINQFEMSVLTLELPYWDFLLHFLFEYQKLEISCQVTFKEIKKHLER